MSYNPYDNQFYDLVNEIEIKETRIKEIDDIIKNHQELKEKLPKEISDLEKNISVLENRIKSLAEEISNYNNDIKSDSVIKEAVGAAGVLGGIALMALNDSPINKLIGAGISILSGGVTAHEINQKKSKKEKLEALEVNLKSLNNNLNNLIKVKIERLAKLEEIENYNPSIFTQEKEEILANLSNIVIELKKIEEEKNRIDNATKDLNNELCRLCADRTKINLDIDTAEKLNLELENADNGYKKKCIHEECERIFQEARPFKVLLSLKEEKKKIDRNIKKIEKRIEEYVKVLASNINLLVIDGNNLCYKNSKKNNKFIGDIALRSLINALLESKFTNRSKILIFFDNEITKLLKLDKQELEDSFENISDKIEIFISNGKADETIINAAEEADAYIISNDRFSDFFDKKAIKEHRVFPYTIKYNSIYIEPLGLKANF